MLLKVALNCQSELYLGFCSPTSAPLGVSMWERRSQVLSKRIELGKKGSSAPFRTACSCHRLLGTV